MMRRQRDFEASFATHLTWLHERSPGMQVSRGESCVVSDSGLPSDTFNTILVLPGLPLALDKLSAAVRGFRDRQLPCCVWGWEEPQLVRALDTLGLQASAREPVLFCDLDHEFEPPPSAIEVRQVGRDADVSDFAETIAGNWEPPDPQITEFYRRTEAAILSPECPLLLLVGCWEGTPAATCEICITNETAGVFSVETRREFRRRGIATALVTAGLALAAQRGCRQACLSASSEGQSVYQRLGFAVRGSITTFE